MDRHKLNIIIGLESELVRQFKRESKTRVVKEPATWAL